MAELSFLEKQHIEELLGMKSGYVLDFTSRTFQELIADTTGKDIYDEKYNLNSGSKANRLRAFMRSESNYDVSLVLQNLVEIKLSSYKESEFPPDDMALELEQVQKIIHRLKKDKILGELDALKPNNQDKDFQTLAKSIRESIDRNEPEVALDRLHTFVVKYVRELCTIHKVAFEKSESLNANFGKYVKFLTENDFIESVMTEKILKYSINIIEAFNDIRNNKSLAHDNPLLNHSESTLIFNNVANAIKFIEDLENKIESKRKEIASTNLNELPS